MKRLSSIISLSLSLFLTANTNAATDIALQLDDHQPLRSDMQAITQTEEAKKAAYATGSQKSVYIVQLAEPAVASYTGDTSGFAATSPRITGARKLDTNAPPSKAYANYLLGKQRQTQAMCEATLGRKLEVKFRYQHTFNGMAMELTAEEAKAISALPEVVHIAQEKFERLLTDVGPQWIGAEAIWNNPRFAHSRGEGIVVAVLDSGINHDHPSFADIGGDGFDHDNPLGSGNYIPGSYCDTVDPKFCNDKLIGAWDMVKTPADPNAPEDSDGHGSHTASTATGNVIPQATVNAPTTSLVRKIGGVAPHANLIIYDVCVDSCPGSALLAAIEQVVIDASVLPNGIHALNYSISGGNDPYNDAVELGFLNATAAGVYVSTSAGNSGPGPSTTGHNSPWVANVAAMTHNRKLENSLVNLSSDGTSLRDMVSVGFTAGYGPAEIVHAADFPTNNGSPNDANPAQCLAPFPAGHFNGQIVVCDRGSIARVAKGANVLAGGAGGLVLANTVNQGESVVGDAHFLPALHIGFSSGEILRDWLATQTNPVATITGTTVNLDPANGDVMAAFSSRGPNLAVDTIKPDIGAPGVSVFAAVASSSSSTTDEYGFLSGTSMASPHNAGSGALISAVRPDWSPYAIKSAIMMTANASGNLKEDGVTTTDHFDVGAGRINLNKAPFSGLILDETPENFLAADPAKGGDPKTLNIASMQDSNCVGRCSWSRTVTNVSGEDAEWRLNAVGSNNLGLRVFPRELELNEGQSATITVSADSALAKGWSFGQLKLRGPGPNLHMPIAVLPTTSSDATILNHDVAPGQAKRGDTLTYQINIDNGPMEGVIELSSVLPRNLRFVKGSAQQKVINGETLSPFAARRNELTWSGTLPSGGLQLQPSPAPFGFVGLSAFVPPFGCPDNCDDGGIILDVPTFTYNGLFYNQVIWSVNGTLQVGSDGLQATSANNQVLPSETPPNNLLAPFWTDLNLGVNGDGAEWYVAVLSSGSVQYTVYEWNNIPLFSDPNQRYSFQIWVENGTTGNIWFVYDKLGNVNPQSGSTVGIENINGTAGFSYYAEGRGTEPAVGTDLLVESLNGGHATFNFKARVRSCRRGDAIVNRVNITNNNLTHTAIAVAECVNGQGGGDDDDDGGDDGGDD